MIDRDRIARAAREADREVEVHGGLPAWAKSHDIDIDGFVYVADQRALRAAMVVDGKDPSNRTTGVVRLGPVAQHLMPTLTANWMDGFAAGFTAKEKPDEAVTRAIEGGLDCLEEHLDEYSNNVELLAAIQAARATL